MRISNEAMWLRGFADGEGSVSKPQAEGLRSSERTIFLCNTEEILIEKACKILGKLDIPYYVRKKKMVNKKPIWLIYISHQENLVKWRDKIGFTSLKKKERLDNLIK